ncbi:fibroblast growth factor 1-like [Cylas formicarius]|uniref:fibroblast growth factor 1-like n=1 Tax=Cylas formicarius TaxID=197179 RepID=UPI0029587D8E|nr:fibroblast growth factor 1-like [Cylas formicarius]
MSDSSSDSNSSDAGDERDNANFAREKRDVSGRWGAKEPPYFPLRRVVWPPPSTSSASRHATRQGNVGFGSKMQLFSKTGYFLAVYADGRVRGTRDENDPHTFLEIVEGGGLPEHVMIRGMLTNSYVAMDRTGRLYAEPDPNSTSAIFVESFQGSYNVYLSRNWAHLGWYLGIKKSGKFKRGPKTKLGQKAIRFLPRRTKFEQ